MITFLVTVSLVALAIWLLMKAVCFVFRLTWGVARIFGIMLIALLAVGFVSDLLI